MDYKKNTKDLIDGLKSTCQNYGLGNDGNEYAVITQLFLYKYMSDKFLFQLKEFMTNKQYSTESFENILKTYENMSNDEIDELKLEINTAFLKPHQLAVHLFNIQNKDHFDEILDNTLLEIASDNIEIYSTQTSEDQQIKLFTKISSLVTTQDKSKFARALIKKINTVSFNDIFEKRESYDFFAQIFEYLNSDYNTNGGGTYAEYYTPHAISTIMARLLVDDSIAKETNKYTCYDPSAGTGTLLMAVAHQVGIDNAIIYSQDISRKSTDMMKLNLILNGLQSSLHNIIQGDTLVDPYHKEHDESSLKKFDFIVSNPPFKLDFSDKREELANQTLRFFAGVPKVPNKDKSKMAIYTLFIQHVVNSLSTSGKAAIVIPTGFVSAQTSIEKKILKYLVENKIIYGCINMPSNVFATTGTKVSVLFFDKSHKNEKVIMIDASKLGEEYREGDSNLRVRLSTNDVDKIVKHFKHQITENGFSVAKDYDEITNNNYSLSAGQYFKIENDHEEISHEEFSTKMNKFKSELNELFSINNKLQDLINADFKELLNAKD